MPRFTLDGRRFTAESCVDGVLVNPRLPVMFDQMPNEERPASQGKWWHRPFIVACSEPVSPHAQCGEAEKERMRQQWFQSWSSGTRYDVRCLDGFFLQPGSRRGVREVISPAPDIYPRWRRHPPTRRSIMKLLDLNAYLNQFPRQPHALKVWVEAAQAVVGEGERLESLSFIDILELSRRAIRNYPAEAREIGLGGFAVMAESMLNNEIEAQLLRNAFGMLENTISHMEQPHPGGEGTCS